ncbi:MAG TPA: hypothetical protein VFO11_10170, partial [Candidatus Polarisedimenticolaceae bacterium]|nr:hypothetical protein [Candidatus Polarisedimenticolaceae bacterium]
MLQAARWIVLGLVSLAGSLGARASCIPDRLFGQVSFDYGYHYVHVPEGLDASWGGIVGRFWRAGGRLAGHEGTLDDSQWLWACQGWTCGNGTPGRVFYLNGFTGMAGVYQCPKDGDLVVALQTPSEDGTWAGFAAGRIDRTPTFLLYWDFSRIDRDWTFAPIPQPSYTRYERTVGGIDLDLAFADVGAAIYTLDPARRTEVVT